MAKYQQKKLWLFVYDISMLALLGFVTSACAGPRPSGVPAAPLTDSTVQAFGAPIQTESDALIAAQGALRTAFNYAEPLTVVSVEQITYAEYSQRFGAGSDHPADLKVWLVVYFDKAWQEIPTGSGVSSIPSFSGCTKVAINAADGSPLEVG